MCNFVIFVTINKLLLHQFVKKTLNFIMNNLKIYDINMNACIYKKRGMTYRFDLSLYNSLYIVQNALFMLLL